MQAHTPRFRPSAARPPTLRNRMALAVARRFGSRGATRPSTDQRPAERLEGMDLDQRVREIGEW